MDIVIDYLLEIALLIVIAIGLINEIFQKFKKK